MIHSLFRTKSALQRYALDPRAKFIIKSDKNQVDNLDTGIIELILSRDFWQDVDIIYQILQPVHEVQKMSESCRSHLGHVLNRWNSIRIKWQAMRESGQYPQVEMIFAGDENSIWTRRYAKQQTDLTWLAWILDPQNDIRSTVNAGRTNNILNLLKRYSSPERHTEIVEDFFAFRDCEGKFGRWRDFWKKDYMEKPLLFWKIVAGEAPHLSALAIRVFSTPANSVPSERSFSAMNFIQDECRSRLSAEKTDMLTFIYINSKVLRQHPSEPAPTWYNLTKDQEEEFEDLAFEYICRFGDNNVE